MYQLVMLIEIDITVANIRKLDSFDCNIIYPLSNMH